jgi:hypothetical protein
MSLGHIGNEDAAKLKYLIFIAIGILFISAARLRHGKSQDC